MGKRMVSRSRNKKDVERKCRIWKKEGYIIKTNPEVREVAFADGGVEWVCVAEMPEG